jgi:hypothetical protein
MLSGYASANDTVRTFDLAPSSPWATTNISVWTNTSPLNITCWTPTTQPLNCSSANTNSSTGGVTVNMIAGNSTLIVFERGYEANGTTWVPVQLTAYNTGSMNRLCGQQPASINASVWATGADISTTPAIANLTVSSSPPLDPPFLHGTAGTPNAPLFIVALQSAVYRKGEKRLDVPETRSAS